MGPCNRHPLLHYTGPFIDVQHRPRIDFDWNRLDGKPMKQWDDALSTLAQVAQLPAALEFEIEMRNRHPLLHYTGPFIDVQQRPRIDFDWNRLDGRPLVYASLGTLQNGSERVFRIIAEACASIPVQLVISLGGGIDRERLGALSGNPIVEKYVPQLELLKRSAAVI